MKRQTAKWVRKAEIDIQSARLLAAEETPLRDPACFLCQQASEKYLKALLQELGESVPKTHDLVELLGLILPHDATLASFERRLETLGQYAVDYRYPGKCVTTRGMAAALRHAERVRAVVRSLLGLPP